MIIVFAFFFFFPFPFATAHEPITTKVRFNKEVIRILQRSCLGCHRPGGIAMSLATYDEARPWAKAIKEELLEKRMPPWHAVRGYGEFRNTPPITQREIDLVVNWVEGGAPKGDEKELPAGPLFSDEWMLGPPELVLKPKDQVEVAAESDEQRTFSLPTGLKEDRWLTAIDLRPGNGSVVHCATFHLEAGSSSGSVIQTKTDSGHRTLEPMSVLSTNPPPPISSIRLSTWAPGERRVLLPDGVGQLVPAGSRIIVTIHYRGISESSNDSSAIGLYLAKTAPAKQIRHIVITDPDSIVPVGVELHRVKTSVTIEDDSEGVAIRPSVHPLIASIQATAYRPDGSSEVLIWTRGYQFDWQRTYYFKRAIALPKGTRVEVIAYFDNSENNPKNPNDPPKQIRWSEISADPLCTLQIAQSRIAK